MNRKDIAQAHQIFVTHIPRQDTLNKQDRTGTAQPTATQRMTVTPGEHSRTVQQMQHELAQRGKGMRTREKHGWHGQTWNR